MKGHSKSFTSIRPMIRERSKHPLCGRWLSRPPIPIHRAAPSGPSGPPRIEPFGEPVIEWAEQIKIVAEASGLALSV